MFPNIAVIEEIKSQHEIGQTSQNSQTAGQAGCHASRTFELIYIGGRNSFEEKLMRERKIPFYGIHAGKLRRYFDLRNFIDVFKVPLGIIEAFFILKKLKPDLVFAKGGYVSMPVAIAARLLKIPVWLHESDVSPGLSTRFCSRFASRIFLSFEETKEWFEKRGFKCKIEVVGNPVRAEITRGSCEEGFRLTGFSAEVPDTGPRKLTILVMGGSIGAKFLNDLIATVLPELVKKVRVIHVTGPQMSQSVVFSPVAPSISQPSASQPSVSHFKSPHYRAFEFLGKELPHIYAISDIIISRAGSASIFESLACAKPMILIPLPKSASRGDQIENAEEFGSQGFAKVLDQDTLTPEKFLRLVFEFLENTDTRARIAENQKKAHYKDAAERIAAEIIKQYDQKN